MLAEVIPCAILILSFCSLVILTNALKLMITIPRVPTAFVLRHARATPRLQLAGFSISDA